MQDPKKLRAYDAAGDLAVAVYTLTRRFPRDERFGLTSQTRRAALSVGSNLAEGCGRQGKRALLAFTFISIGSCNELEFQLGVAHRLKFVDNESLAPVLEQTSGVRRMLINLTNYLKRRLDDGDTE